MAELIASPDVRNYYALLGAEAAKAYTVANSARAKGYDPETTVEKLLKKANDAMDALRKKVEGSR